VRLTTSPHRLVPAAPPPPARRPSLLQVLAGAAVAAVASAHKEYVPLNPNGANAGVKAIG